MGMETKHIIDAFSKWQLGRSFSQATVKRRAVAIGSLDRHIYPMTLDGVGPSDVEEWIGGLRAPRTRHGYRSDANSLYTWGVRRGVFASNPVALTDGIRLPKPLPKPIPAHLLPGLLATSTPRVRLALTLAAYAGLRCSEVANLTTGDVGAAVLTVRHGKGDKDRTVPLHPTLAAELARWRLPQGAHYIDVSAATLGRNVSAHLRACGVDATMHCGRHTFGTELARVSRGNLSLVGALMGHESTDTTKGYVAIAGLFGVDDVRAMFGAA